jgi:light-regulated signal transduction histidine kinase (bacteriophytochrome)
MMNTLNELIRSGPTSREQEPIHLSGAVQPHGALLAFDPCGERIVHAGGNVMNLLGMPLVSIIGTKIDRILDIATTGRVRHAVAANLGHDHAFVPFSMPGHGAGSNLDVTMHQSGGLVVLEFEPRTGADAEDPLVVVQAMAHAVQRAKTVQTFCEALAHEVRMAAGFERVLVYRFERDDSGVVVAESRCEDVESLLGLRYPESDIPRQARALYLANTIRLIPDAGHSPAPIIPATNPETGQPLDLSHSVLRSVSPSHLSYLTHMGVAASMSLAIIIRGRLWGLVACHHRKPHFVSRRLRSALEVFTNIVLTQLDVKIVAEALEARLSTKEIQEGLVRNIIQEADLAEGLIRFSPNLLDFISATGVGLWFEGKYSGFGVTPTRQQMETLVEWLNEQKHTGVVQTDCLPLHCPQAEHFADIASGILALSVSKHPSDYIVWFRPEVVRTVTWAGDPDKNQGGKIRGAGPDGRLGSPRQSFQAWQQSVRLHSKPWADEEVEAAHELRLSLLEVVLERINQIAREREQARLRQNELLRELDHRLEQWQAMAGALTEETKRRAIAEQELSAVLRRTVLDQEAERLRIARELHDTLGQSLTLLQLGLDGVAQSPHDKDGVRQRIAALKALAVDVGRDVSRLAWEIRPTVLDDLGLQTAIRSLLEAWSERTSIRFDLHIAINEQRLPNATETTLYRVLQEALTNVVRHAGATKVTVILTGAERQVTMIVEDDGRGFDERETDGPPLLRRLGLVGMRERLSIVKGSVELETGPGQGTTLFVHVPV